MLCLLLRYLGLITPFTMINKYTDVSIIFQTINKNNNIRIWDKLQRDKQNFVSIHNFLVKIGIELFS